jgi:flap endonuclease-1
MCILCGCDYLEPLKGIGAKTAYKLIKDNGSIEAALEELREKDAKSKKDKKTVPEDWPWREAQQLFKKPSVTPSSEVNFTWAEPDIDGLVEFLVTEKGFNEDRVRKGADKLRIALKAKQQGRLDGFFTVTPKPSSSSPDKKRKVR